jgi:signal transduction histidine kinase
MKGLAYDLHPAKLHALGLVAAIRLLCDHASQPHLGLVSMRERVAFLSGQLAIDAAPGEGTRIAVQIPLVSSGQRPEAEGPVVKTA